MARETGRLSATITPLTVEQLASRMLPQLCPPRGNQAIYREVVRAFEGLDRMGIKSSTDLVPTPEFLVRFLDAVGGSTRRKAVGRLLIRLANIIDYALAGGHLAPSIIAASRPIPIPPEWDEQDESFARGGDKAPPRRPFYFPAPEWDDFIKVTSAMAAASFAWPIARIYMISSTVVLARLNWSEVLALEVSDYRPEVGELHIAQRARVRKANPEAPSHVEVSPPLASLWTRWIPRIHSRYAFPLLSRTAPLHRPTASREIEKFARDVLSPGDASSRFTPGGLLAFGKAHKTRLSDSKESPFAIQANNLSTLIPRDVTIERLRGEVIARGLARENQSLCLRILDRFASMPEVRTMADLTPEMISRYFTAFIPEPDRRYESGKRLNEVRWIGTLCRYGIDLGGIDLDPLEKVPEITTRKWAAPKQSPQLLRTRLRLFTSMQLLAMARENQVSTRSRRCPVELRGRSTNPLVYGQEVPMLTRAEYNLIDALTQAFQEEIDGYSREALSTETRDEAPWMTYKEMRQKNGYEPWLEVLPDRKGARKGEPFQMIDPREGNW